jgi:hypothetical protein
LNPAALPHVKYKPQGEGLKTTPEAINKSQQAEVPLSAAIEIRLLVEKGPI